MIAGYFHYVIVSIKYYVAFFMKQQYDKKRSVIAKLVYYLLGGKMNIKRKNRFVRSAGIAWVVLSFLLFTPLLADFIMRTYTNLPHPLDPPSFHMILLFVLPGIIASFVWFIPQRTVVKGWEYFFALSYLVLDMFYYIYYMIALIVAVFLLLSIEVRGGFFYILFLLLLISCTILVITTITPSFIMIRKMRHERKETQKSDKDNLSSPVLA